jgi:hypothetical protein
VKCYEFEPDFLGCDDVMADPSEALAKKNVFQLVFFAC